MVDPKKRRRLAIVMSAGRGGGRPRIKINTNFVAENSAEDTVVGTPYVQSGTAAGTITLSDQSNTNWFKMVSGVLKVGSVSPNFETNSSPTVTLTDGVITTTIGISVTNVFEAANLADELTLDDTDIPQGSAATINIGSATTGSTITLLSGSLPAGLTLNSGARTITGTPTTVAAASSFTLRETLADSANSPRDTVFAGITVSDATAPTLSSATDAASGATTANISVSTNEANGTLYWYISTSATPPSGADLKAGTGAVTSGNQAVTTTGIQSASASSLTAETAYYTYFLHRDAAGNDSSIAAADGFTTSAGGGGTAGEPMGLLLALLKAA